ncbi:hypothetical protein [uncultured Ruminococcus sp.]|jgi:hypothetical protein|uniref:hypothetical protein n=1 Tax=uncultured Ruminococcus sp. TaxID=165186 RepID=UPI0025FE260C|nr:hypothetical protein [uncultured Ruminococcus sp.]
MKSKKNILAAIAAMSVMASAMSLNAFAAEETEVAEETVAITAVAEDEAEDTAEEAVEEAVEVETPDLIVPPAELDEDEKPVPPEPPVILDVTEFIDQIRTFIDANSIDILTDTILDNWDQIEKVDIHFHSNEKPVPPVPPEDEEKPEVDEEAAEDAEEAEDAEDVEKPTKPLGPVHLELTDLFMEFRDKVDLSKVDFLDEETIEKILNAKDVHADVHFVNPNKPEPPTPPTPPEPPVAPEDGEKPVPPTPPTPPEPPVAPVHEHLGPKEREALKAAEAAEAEEATETVAEETTEAATEAEAEADAE